MTDTLSPSGAPALTPGPPQPQVPDRGRRLAAPAAGGTRAVPDARPLRRRLELAALLLATAVLYVWNLGASGWANAFYSAAAQAGSQDWTAWFFGSSDAANAITVDKPPASLWVMDATPLQSSAAVAVPVSLGSFEAEQSIAVFAGQVIVGAVVSVTVMVCVQLLGLPQLSVAVHVRAMV